MDTAVLYWPSLVAVSYSNSDSVFSEAWSSPTAAASSLALLVCAPTAAMYSLYSVVTVLADVCKSLSFVASVVTIVSFNASSSIKLNALIKVNAV